jgi:hypothetical protein
MLNLIALKKYVGVPECPPIRQQHYILSKQGIPDISKFLFGSVW